VGVELLLQPNGTKAGTFRKKICLFLPMFKVSNADKNHFLSLRNVFHTHIILINYTNPETERS
jgi:hypothetical protein